MNSDMRNDIFGKFSSGKAALKKMAKIKPLSENFRIYYGSHLPDSKGIRYVGAEFKNDKNGKLTIMEKGSRITVDVNADEASEFEDDVI